MSGRTPFDAANRDRLRTSLDETILVEASAGTGKTTELVHRTVNLLGSGTPVESVVVLTFTEKAAGELKLRVREGLDRVRATEPDLARRRRLDAALARLEEAHINTIHGFCADLLRERPVEAGVDPAFEVLVESEARRMYGRVFDEWFAGTLENPPEGVRRSLGRRGEQDGDSDAGPVERLRQSGWELTTWRDLPASWHRDQGFDRRGRVEALSVALSDFARLTASPARKGDNLALDTAFVRRASAEIQDEVAHGRADLDVLEGRLAALARHPGRSRIRKGSGAEYAAGVPRASVTAACDALFAAVDAFTREADADLAALLRDELWDTVARYQDAKNATGRLDFVDLLVFARGLLRDHADVRADFQGRFTRILVDEFQDTDPTQAEILFLLAAADPAADDWRRLMVAPGKLFIVADPKQSIYRFRRADVGTYAEVKRILGRQGIEPLELSTSFRAVPSIQRFVNTVFGPVMTEDAATLQAPHVPLRPWRDEHEGQPSLVALPVPAPYGLSRISGVAIEGSLPDAVGAFVAWLLEESGWTVTERTTRDPVEKRVAIAPRHVCLLFRRFESRGRDVTYPYLRALEARDVPHLLVGGRSFDGREEIETMKAALCAVEWPGDELSVYATLRGALFALPDALLLRWRREIGRFDPFRIPDDVDGEPGAVAEALRTLRRLHAGRNRVPVADTVSTLLETTRAHTGFALRPSGEQALANVLHLAELARRYESGGGVSFRGFVEDLVDGRFGDESQAPILEAGGDGVRVMTLHKAKGLEFPAVILCDITAGLAPRRASRYLDPASGRCAFRLAGCAPRDLLDQEEGELARERAEGLRIAYVAATRARDLIVVPAVGDEPYDSRGEKWVSVLNTGLYPPLSERRTPAPARGCPAFTSRDTVTERPGGEPASPTTVAPGMYRLATARGPTGRSVVAPPGTLRVAPAAGRSSSHTGLDTAEGEPIAGPAPSADEPTGTSATYPVVWWDPSRLHLNARPAGGLRETELIGRDADPDAVEADLAAYRQWEVERGGTTTRGSRPAMVVRAVTVHATLLAGKADTGGRPAVVAEDEQGIDGRDGGDLERRERGAGALAATNGAPDPSVDVVRLPRAATRASGVRYGSLVHAVLSVVPLDADADAIDRITDAQSRLLGSTAREIAAAAEAVRAALDHDLLMRAREAERRGACRREAPVTVLRDGVLLEGQVDLAFQNQDGTWCVVDFKTDEDVERELEGYRHQVAIYAAAITEATGRSASGVLLVV